MSKAIRTTHNLVLPCPQEVAARLAFGQPSYNAGVGQALFYAGHTPVGFFVLLAGNVRLMGPGHTLTAQAPALLGLHHYLECRPYPATATVSGPCRVAFVARGVPPFKFWRRTTDRTPKRMERVTP